MWQKIKFNRIMLRNVHFSKENYINKFKLNKEQNKKQKIKGYRCNWGSNSGLLSYWDNALTTELLRPANVPLILMIPYLDKNYQCC